METMLPRVAMAVCRGMLDTLAVDLVTPGLKDPQFKPDEATMAEVQEHIRTCPHCRQELRISISTINQKLQAMVDQSNELKNLGDAYRDVLEKSAAL